MVRFSGDYVKKLQGVDHIEWRFFSVLTVGKDKLSQHLKLRWWDNVLVVKVASYHPRVLRRLALPPLIILPLMELPWWEKLIRRWERLELRFGVGWCDGNASCVSQHATLFNPYSRQERWLDHGFALVGKHSSEATRGVHACGNIHQPPLFFKAGIKLNRSFVWNSRRTLVWPINGEAIPKRREPYSLMDYWWNQKIV